MYFRITLITLISALFCAGCAKSIGELNSMSSSELYDYCDGVSTQHASNYHGDDAQTYQVMQGLDALSADKERNCQEALQERIEDQNRRWAQEDFEKKKRKDMSCYDANGKFDTSYCDDK